MSSPGTMAMRWHPDRPHNREKASEAELKTEDVGGCLHKLEGSSYEKIRNSSSHGTHGVPSPDQMKSHYTEATRVERLGTCRACMPCQASARARLAFVSRSLSWHLGNPLVHHPAP